LKPSKASILAIDDELGILQVLQEILEAEGYGVAAATSGAGGLALLEEQRFDLTITDLSMPGLGGLEVLQYLVQHQPECPCIIITGFASIPSAVAAMRQGAYSYLAKPVDAAELRLVVARALEHHHLKRENLQLKKQLHRRYAFTNMVGQSPAITRVFDLIHKVADTDSTVLIQGESGTGKELIAHALHYHSSRHGGPLIPVNCAAIPEELLESELFGHERGAFTHAVRTRLGRFEQADGGTIFLDEISEMSPGLQVKILRVLQDHAFERIGGVKTIRVDIRVIAATNRNLEDLVAGNHFREDLYYRLNVIPITVPPLRERLSDIPLLVQHFLGEFSRKRKKPQKRFSPAVMDSLLRYSWPGNVRELENLVERLVLLAEGETIEADDLPEKFQAGDPGGQTVFRELPAEGADLNAALLALERRLILQALERSNWVKSRAARLLHLNRTTLLEKMKKQNIAAVPNLPMRPDEHSG
jgi:DNA-binding NtrC family response regulator